MVKRFCSVLLVGAFLLMCSGCAVVGAALSAGMAYGIYQATRK